MSALLQISIPASAARAAKIENAPRVAKFAQVRDARFEYSYAGDECHISCSPEMAQCFVEAFAMFAADEKASPARVLACARAAQIILEALGRQIAAARN